MAKKDLDVPILDFLQDIVTGQPSFGVGGSQAASIWWLIITTQILAILKNMSVSYINLSSRETVSPASSPQLHYYNYTDLFVQSNFAVISHNNYLEIKSFLIL